MISEEIKEFLSQQRLGYVATVTPNGKPNLSPKGTIIGWNNTSLAFADIRSPDTITNLKNNSNVEINVIDPLLRKGYLFKGEARIITDSNLYADILAYYRSIGVKSPINSIVMVSVSHVSEVTSPLYDLGISEQEIKSKWKKHFANL
ncbi:MAG: pyridoxamine 5'-phosphate oxidase family protein [Nitrosopumilus sp.]|uniref:pyridoxamine 5'-phosphate oxidase family protein n=1 Tax=Nitrosopumilus sp. TaxID=2024843 RepID=UPI00247E0173|nr:pyridoxamine 5'-phosphate oxidase family protein [Nitrosopumilus sp.]MCV0391848.1 pyridoxamine 5'-phosphate oxidase family protein [Nitrosopumilus sp.]